MGVYSFYLTCSALVTAAGAGFLLARAPRQRATQVIAALLAGAAWWALSEGCSNAADDAAGALVWLRLMTPGWAFLGAFVPHASARYFDAYPGADMERRRRLMMRIAQSGYACGAAMVALAALAPGLVFRDLARVPWGWNFAPGPAQMLFFALVGPATMASVALGLAGFRAPVAVAPRVHRIAVLVGLGTPALAISLTEVLLPTLHVDFPRLGSSSYALFSLLIIGVMLRYGLSFLTPNDFADEILDTLHEGVAMVTPKGHVRRVNRGLARLAGLAPEALVGRRVDELLRWEAPQDLRVLEDEPAELYAAGGERIPVSLSSAPLRDAGGNAMAAVMVVRDRREIEELRRRMVTQARLAAVGELAAGLAHEINNPLAYVRTNLGLLESHWKTLAEPEGSSAERASLLAESRELIEESRVGVDRAAEVVRGVRRFTHAGHPVREPADLNELVEDTLAMLRPQVRSAELSIEFRAGRLPLLPCAPQELRQVFLNLIVNAIDAVRGHGKVSIATRGDGEQVIFEVRDNGCGIPAETLERIFDPFFTTKKVGEGTGLGLAIAWHIVDAHGGHLEVESPPGAGATFRVCLPVEGNGGSAGETSGESEDDRKPAPGDSR